MLQIFTNPEMYSWQSPKDLFDKLLRVEEILLVVKYVNREISVMTEAILYNSIAISYRRFN